MRPFEGDPDYAVRSDVRFCRARDLLAEQPAGSVTPEVLRTILSDHENKPDAVCRHPEFGDPDVQDRLLVHGRRDRRAASCSAAGTRATRWSRSTCSRTTGLPEAPTGPDPAICLVTALGREIEDAPPLVVRRGGIGAGARRSSTLVRVAVHRGGVERGPPPP